MRPDRTYFEAAGSSKLDARFRHNTRILLVKLGLVGQLETLDPTLEYEKDLSISTKDLLHWEAQPKKITSLVLEDVEDYLETYSRILIADSATIVDRKSFEFMLEPYLDLFDGHDFEGKGPLSYGTALVTYTLHYRFATTRRGNTCLVPACAEREDDIYVIFSCAAPFILRKIEDKYYLIGEAYINSIILSEALK